ncbi:hypothetical protein L596_007563 [Steinernema carpocapsae]|uniref:Uncharacterized protein n=1 Tax=Steinernema carpocapsae TaxID=34508 RepID=A0A4U5PA36_STECR|nr:hypothetical protein L596_007563 [Steinernema carpocapsae]
MTDPLFTGRDINSVQQMSSRVIIGALMHAVDYLDWRSLCGETPKVAPNGGGPKVATRKARWMNRWMSGMQEENVE